MKSHFTLPKDESFFTRYATLTPTLDKLGIIAQVVNALTEIGIIYAIVYAAVADFFPSLAPFAAAIGCVLGTLLLEGGLRKLAPYSARAILHKRYKGLDGWMTGFIFLSVAGLYLTSAALSFQGSKTLVKSLSSAPTEKTTYQADSIYKAAQMQALHLYRQDSANVVARFAAQAEAIRVAATSQVEARRAEIATIESRERATNQPMTTRKKELRAKIKEIEADRDGKLAALETDKASEQAATLTTFKRAQDTAQDEYNKEKKSIATTNATTLQRHEQTVAHTGGSLAWFTIICHLVFALSIGLNEIHRKGSGIEQQPQPNQWYFSQSWIDDFTHMISDRFNYKVRTWIANQAAKTPAPPPPTAPPTLWELKEHGLPRRVIELTDDGQPHTASDQQTPRRRQIGFKTSLYKRPNARGQNQSVTNATVITQPLAQTNSKLIKDCEQCGQMYQAKVIWQRFCCGDCKDSYHAAQHNGQAFNPKRYHKKQKV